MAQPTSSSFVSFAQIKGLAWAGSPALKKLPIFCKSVTASGIAFVDSEALMKLLIDSTMKLLSLLFIATALTFTVSCKEKTVGDKVDDALDNRPAEKVQDKAEDVKDKVKDATN